MRVLSCLWLLLFVQAAAHAAPSRVWWPQWIIESSEELWAGQKYSSYPIPLMLDGDPKTAWVYSAKSKEFAKDVFTSRYGFVFTPSTPITLDALRIMNGQNRSRVRFFKNHRITKIRVTQETVDKKKVVTQAKLSDAMGWHPVKLPRHKIKSLKIEFPEIARSKSKNADVCISELELRDAGKKIDWRLPRAVMFLDGLEGCGASLLISRQGRVLDGIAMDIGYDDKWSHNGRYVVGFAGGGNYVWIADVWRGGVIRKYKCSDIEPDYRWRNARTLVITEHRHNKKSLYRFLKAPDFQ